MEYPNSSYNTQKKHVNNNIIAVKFYDGRTHFVAYIPDNTPDWRNKLKDAMSFFSAQYKNKGYIEVHNNELMMNDTIPSWDTIKKDIIKHSSNNQVTNWLISLQSIGTPSWLIDTIQKDLQVSDNKKLLENYVSIADWSKEEKKQTLLALEIALQAHA